MAWNRKTWKNYSRIVVENKFVLFDTWKITWKLVESKIEKKISASGFENFSDTHGETHHHIHESEKTVKLRHIRFGKNFIWWKLLCFSDIAIVILLSGLLRIQFTCSVLMNWFCVFRQTISVIVLAKYTFSHKRRYC